MFLLQMMLLPGCDVTSAGHDVAGDGVAVVVDGDDDAVDEAVQARNPRHWDRNRARPPRLLLP